LFRFSAEFFRAMMTVVVTYTFVASIKIAAWAFTTGNVCYQLRIVIKALITSRFDHLRWLAKTFSAESDAVVDTTAFVTSIKIPARTESTGGSC